MFLSCDPQSVQFFPVIKKSNFRMFKLMLLKFYGHNDSFDTNWHPLFYVFKLERKIKKSYSVSLLLNIGIKKENLPDSGSCWHDSPWNKGEASHVLFLTIAKTLITNLYIYDN